MKALKLTFLLPLVISLTTAPEGCVSLGLLSQSIVIVTKASMRLRHKLLWRICGFGPKPRYRALSARALVGQESLGAVPAIKKVLEEATVATVSRAASPLAVAWRRPDTHFSPVLT